MKKGVDYIGVGVGAIIANDQGKVFLSLRGREARNERGKWEFPGGGLEFMESFESGLKREIKEEYDIDIEVYEMLDVQNHVIHEEKQHWVSPSFICKYLSGTATIMEPHKCDEIGWFSITEIAEKDLSIITKQNLNSLRSNKNKYASLIRY